MSPTPSSLFTTLFWFNLQRRNQTKTLFLLCSCFLFAMALLSDLINLNLSDSTKKIIAEYIWWEPLLTFFFLPLLCSYSSFSSSLRVFVLVYMFVLMGLFILVSLVVGFLCFCDIILVALRSLFCAFFVGFFSLCFGLYGYWGNGGTGKKRYGLWLFLLLSGGSWFLDSSFDQFLLDPCALTLRLL